MLGKMRNCLVFTAARSRKAPTVARRVAASTLRPSAGNFAFRHSGRDALDQRVTFAENEGPKLDVLKDPSAFGRLKGIAQPAKKKALRAERPRPVP